MDNRTRLGVALLIIASCSRDAISVPTKDGQSTCLLSSSDIRRGTLTRWMVHDKCGQPCGQGELHKGYCPPGAEQGLVSFCSNNCEVYGDTAVCYIGDTVVAVLRLQDGETHGPLRPCFWTRSERSPESSGPGVRVSVTARRQIGPSGPRCDL